MPVWLNLAGTVYYFLGSFDEDALASLVSLFGFFTHVWVWGTIARGEDPSPTDLNMGSFNRHRICALSKAKPVTIRRFVWELGAVENVLKFKRYRRKRSNIIFSDCMMFDTQAYWNMICNILKERFLFQIFLILWIKWILCLVEWEAQISAPPPLFVVLVFVLIDVNRDVVFTSRGCYQATAGTLGR